MQNNCSVNECVNRVLVGGKGCPGWDVTPVQALGAAVTVTSIRISKSFTNTSGSIIPSATTGVHGGAGTQLTKNIMCRLITLLAALVEEVGDNCYSRQKGLSQSGET